MNLTNIIEKLSKVPRTQRIVLYAVGVIVLAAAFWALVYLPSTESLESLKVAQTKLKADKATVDASVKNRDKFRVELDALNEDLKQAMKELPNDREIPGLLKGISSLGKKVGLEVRRFQPLPEEPQDYVAAVPVSLEVSGSYHEVAMFFDRLSKMNRIVYVQDIEIKEPVERGGKVFLTVEGNAVTFRFLSEEEREQYKKTQGAKGKGGKGKKAGS